MSSPMIFEQTRGETVESRHRVHALWIDEKGREIRSHGDTEQSVNPRSSFKPIQVLPLVISKAFESAPEPWRALAVATASHSAENIHVKTVGDWLAKLGLDETNLVCGAHWPRDPERIFAMGKRDERPTRLHSNCSGKHTGMLAACRALGFPIEGYQRWDHPLQVRIREHASHLGDIDADRAAYGTDGCSLPSYFFPMHAFARMLSHYLRPESSPFPEALKLVREAWTKHPEMVGGTGTLDTCLAQVTKGRVLAKIGAQGNYMALDFERGRALVFKIENGADLIREQVLLEILADCGSLTASEVATLRETFPREIRNWDNQVVGENRLWMPNA